jgi:High potential iron-sulfur protein
MPGANVIDLAENLRRANRCAEDGRFDHRPRQLQGGLIMADTVSRQARRRFLELATAGVAAAPLCASLARLARAQERVEEDDELAQQLGYKHDASQVDPNEWPDYEPGETCANCQLYHGEEGAEWGPCDIFGGQLVNANGWCVSWLEKEA